MVGKNTKRIRKLRAMERNVEQLKRTLAMRQAELQPYASAPSNKTFAEACQECLSICYLKNNHGYYYDEEGFYLKCFCSRCNVVRRKLYPRLCGKGLSLEEQAESQEGDDSLDESISSLDEASDPSITTKDSDSYSDDPQDATEPASLSLQAWPELENYVDDSVLTDSSNYESDVDAESKLSSGTDLETDSNSSENDADTESNISSEYNENSKSSIDVSQAYDDAPMHREKYLIEVAAMEARYKELLTARSEKQLRKRIAALEDQVEKLLESNRQKQHIIDAESEISCESKQQDPTNVADATLEAPALDADMMNSVFFSELRKLLNARFEGLYISINTEAKNTDHNEPDAPSHNSSLLDPDSQPSAVGLDEKFDVDRSFTNVECQTEFSCSDKTYSQAVDIATCTSTHQENVSCQTDPNITLQTCNVTCQTTQPTLAEVAMQTVSIAQTDVACQAEPSVDQSSVYNPAAAIHSLTVSEKSKLNLKKLQLLDYYFSNNIEPSIVSQATQRESGHLKTHIHARVHLAVRIQMLLLRSALPTTIVIRQ